MQKKYFLYNFFIIFLNTIIMAKGKRTFQVGKSSQGGGRRDYVYAVQKKNLKPGEKLKLKKYDKVSRTHKEYTFVDVK